MRKEIMMLGLTGLIYAGCDEFKPKSDVSKVEGSVNLIKPEDCEKVEDIRYNTLVYDSVPGNTIQYHVLCSDKEKNLILYVRCDTDDSWRKVTVK